MKIKGKIIPLLLFSAFILTSTFNVSFANQASSNGYDAFSKNAELIEVNEWNQYENSEELCKTNSMQKNKKQTISEVEDKLGDNIILHNNGDPIKTNIFERKDGNELFAIALNNINGIEQKTYYIKNIDDIDMKSLLNDIDTQEEVNATVENNIPMASSSVRNYKWDFYATGKDGVKRQQGSLATSISFARRSKSTSINGVKGSVWDIDSSSQLLSRSNGFINNHATRIDVNQPNQTLYSWGPYDSGKTTATVSLNGLVNPKEWSFPINGFSVNDDSKKGSKYGRWTYNAHITTAPKKMNTRPGVRVTNTKGKLVTKLSQTAKIATPYAISNHSTGVITIYIPDR